VKITLIISSLSGGGAERVISIMANYCAKAAHQSTLLTFDDCNSQHYHISESLQWQALNISCQSNPWTDEFANNLKRIHVLCKFILQSKSIAYTHTKDTKRIFFEIPLVTLKYVPQNMWIVHY
jgi:hypothetical protein